jgi:hypothetical protein
MATASICEAPVAEVTVTVKLAPVSVTGAEKMAAF